MKIISVSCHTKGCFEVCAGISLFERFVPDLVLQLFRLLSTKKENARLFAILVAPTEGVK